MKYSKRNLTEAKESLSSMQQVRETLTSLREIQSMDRAIESKRKEIQEMEEELKNRRELVYNKDSGEILEDPNASEDVERRRQSTRCLEFLYVPVLYVDEPYYEDPWNIPCSMEMVRWSKIQTIERVSYGYADGFERRDGTRLIMEDGEKIYLDLCVESLVEVMRGTYHG